ncbi:MAG: TdeIII family type II restriction endonuclease [archaeon YNP-LCB-003-016]|uniref:TdeIII family type II restriction endonuclease n=1 Tax=Candidatus Culexarchaeum yellowstonense TaxID=2928963 RepID=UPI0026F0469B|nr:TdeIII family type II restriction endonuclease [Candidatus Culexarchaeum yellowstonense]MCR6691991.1 TdeIII family type II restriction endonuclease [Candidatus Culexarchaeum yellowstonense]
MDGNVMKPETREMLKDTLLSFVRSVIEVPYDVEELKRAYPFHALIFPGEALKAFKKQRSIVTRMGRQLIPKLAEIVARDRYVDVHRDYEIVGWIDAAKMEVIDGIVNELRMGRRKPNHLREVEEIIAAKGGEKREVRIIADLFVGDFKTGPLYLEIKSPLPNLDVCAESKRKMLIFQALFEDRMPQAFLALYYNPYYPKPYKHPFTKRVMDLEHEVLIGGEMWDKLGGEGTYNELLNIIGEVEKLMAESTSK